MSKIEVTYTKEEIENYATRDRVLGYRYFGEGGGDTDHSNDYSVCSGYYSMLNYDMNRSEPSSRIFNGEFNIPTNIVRYRNNGRICGYVVGENADGSLQLFLLGDNIDFSPSHSMFQRYTIDWHFTSDQDAPDDPERVPTASNMLVYYDGEQSEQNYVNYKFFVDDGSTTNYLTPLQALDYAPSWKTNTSNTLKVNGFISTCSRYARDYVTYNNRYGNLTKNPDTTLELGHPFGTYFYSADTNFFTSWGYRNIGGALYDIGLEVAGLFHGSIVGTPVDSSFPANVYGGNSEMSVSMMDAGLQLGTYAMEWIPFNIPLTRNLAEAQNYVDTGDLPSDCWIFPYDVDNIPINNDAQHPTVDPDTPPGGDDPEDDEDGDTTDNVDPMPITPPTSTGQSLTNNNLYWVTNQQLKRFIDWFWTDATDIASLGDLWDKITGLYENLAECILAVRYFPVDASWIGGTSGDTKIIVGMIEKEETVATLNKTVPTIRNIGTINIQEKYKSFTDYAPYTDISIYLPFHGMIDLDINLLETKSLAVQVAYDVMSGTIQYFVYRNGYNGQLVNTCVAKMGTDIPITLQTKNQRDSATFQNVASATGSLIGAGASLATGNPIGLTMSMAGFAGSQTQGAKMDIKGTMSENGAYYTFPKCAVYIKHPTYNRPKQSYAQHVGYPCNASYNLTDGMGYTVIFNPSIKFTHNTKPLQKEIDMIYQQMEKGVIL